MWYLFLFIKRLPCPAWTPDSPATLGGGHHQVETDDGCSHIVSVDICYLSTINRYRLDIYIGETHLY